MEARVGIAAEVRTGTIEFIGLTIQQNQQKRPDLYSDDMYRVAMRQMMGVFAELDRKSIVYKLRAARQRSRRGFNHRSHEVIASRW
jgi:hypothetical protein